MTTAAVSKFEYAFWRWQVFGWLLYGAAMFVAAAQVLSATQALVNKSVNVATGFALSLVLRSIYSRLRAAGASWPRVVFAMLAACLLAGALWSVVGNSFFWLYVRGSLAGMGAADAFSWTLVHAIVYVAWSAIFIGAVQVDELRRGREQSPGAPLVVKAEGELVRLPQHEIHCVEAARNYCCIVADSGTHVVRLPLATLAARLDSREFMRVHRSAIVAIRRVQSLRPLPTQDAVAVLPGGREIRVSRNFRAQLEQALTRQH